MPQKKSNIFLITGLRAKDTSTTFLGVQCNFFLSRIFLKNLIFSLPFLAPLRSEFLQKCRLHYQQQQQHVLAFKISLKINNQQLLFQKFASTLKYNLKYNSVMNIQNNNNIFKNYYFSMILHRFAVFYCSGKHWSMTNLINILFQNHNMRSSFFCIEGNLKMNLGLRKKYIHQFFSYL